MVGHDWGNGSDDGGFEPLVDVDPYLVHWSSCLYSELRYSEID